MSAPDVLAVMDDARDVLTALGSPGTANGVAEARAAVAEAFAERDRLRNIVRSHEAQILRMMAERAAVAELVEAVAAVYGDQVPCVSDDNAGDDPCQPDCMSCRIRAALARVGGAK